MVESGADDFEVDVVGEGDGVGDHVEADLPFVAAMWRVRGRCGG